jgi:hypothetical protein
VERAEFQSNEEWFFYNWLIEARKRNLVSCIEYQPAAYKLSERVAVMYEKKMKTKKKYVEKFLFHPHSYTPDFRFIVHPLLENFFVRSRYMQECEVVVDVKGQFNKFSDQKQFAINQKWVYVKYGVYVEKIIPEKLFKKTWCPVVCRWSPKKKQPVKKYIDASDINEFLKKMEGEN